MAASSPHARTGQTPKTPALRNTDASAVHTATALEFQVAPPAGGRSPPTPGHPVGTCWIRQPRAARAAVSEPVGQPAGAGQFGIAQRPSSSVSDEPGLNRNSGLYRTFRCAPRVRQLGGALVSG